MTFMLWHIALAACACFIVGFGFGITVGVERYEEVKAKDYPAKPPPDKFLMNGRGHW